MMHIEKGCKNNQLKLYYCTSCGFARAFRPGYADFDRCPACGSNSYVESSLSENDQESSEVSDYIDED